MKVKGLIIKFICRIKLLGFKQLPPPENSIIINKTESYYEISNKKFWINKLKNFSKIRRNQNISIATGLKIGLNTKFKCDQNSFIQIEQNCDIHGKIIALCGGYITIGENSTIRYNSEIGSANNISIGKYVIISNNVHIYDSNHHPTDPMIRKQMCIDGFYGEPWSWKYAKSSPIIIEDNVWIGERSTILKGVKIGEGSIVACDSVVTHSIPKYCIAAGNPAKVVKFLNKQNESINCSQL